MIVDYVAIPDFETKMAFGAYFNANVLCLPIDLFELAARCHVPSDHYPLLISWLKHHPSVFENMLGIDVQLAKARVSELVAFVDAHGWAHRPDIPFVKPTDVAIEGESE